MFGKLCSKNGALGRLRLSRCSYFVLSFVSNHRTLHVNVIVYVARKKLNELTSCTSSTICNIAIPCVRVGFTTKTKPENRKTEYQHQQQQKTNCLIVTYTHTHTRSYRIYTIYIVYSIYTHTLCTVMYIFYINSTFEQNRNCNIVVKVPKLVPPNTHTVHIFRVVQLFARNPNSCFMIFVIQQIAHIVFNLFL